MTKLKIWIGVIFSYLIKFGAPLGIAYWKFAVYEEGVGGSFFFFIVGIIFIAFYVKLRNVIKKQKASRTKVVFKLFLNVITGAMIYFIVDYIGTNFNELVWVVLSWIGAYLASSIIDFFVIPLDPLYLEEIGVI
jgi:hypothetical protein